MQDDDDVSDVGSGDNDNNCEDNDDNSISWLNLKDVFICHITLLPSQIPDPGCLD